MGMCVVQVLCVMCKGLGRSFITSFPPAAAGANHHKSCVRMSSLTAMGFVLDAGLMLFCSVCRPLAPDQALVWLCTARAVHCWTPPVGTLQSSVGKLPRPMAAIRYRQPTICSHTGCPGNQIQSLTATLSPNPSHLETTCHQVLSVRMGLRTVTGKCCLHANLHPPINQLCKAPCQLEAGCEKRGIVCQSAPMASCFRAGVGNFHPANEAWDESSVRLVICCIAGSRHRA